MMIETRDDHDGGGDDVITIDDDDDNNGDDNSPSVGLEPQSLSDLQSPPRNDEDDNDDSDDDDIDDDSDDDGNDSDDYDDDDYNKDQKTNTYLCDDEDVTTMKISVNSRHSYIKMCNQRIQ